MRWHMYESALLVGTSFSVGKKRKGNEAVASYFL